MKIAIISCISSLDTNYAIIKCIELQLKMLTNNGYQIELFVTSSCKEVNKTGIFSSNMVRWNYFEDSVIDKFNLDYINELLIILKSVKHCFVHDVFSYKRFNIIGEYISNIMKQKPDMKIFAWTHSLLYCDCQLRKFFSHDLAKQINCIALSNYQRDLFVKRHPFAKNRCIIIPNMIDLFQSMNMEVKDISNKIDLCSPYFIIVYPARLDSNKNHEEVIRLTSCLKDVSKEDVLVMFCDTPDPGSNIYSNMKYKNEIKKLANKLKINESIYFTSDLGYYKGIKNDTVLELFSLSNLFIFPSLTESFGMITIEAALKGNFIVLNKNTNALKEIGCIFKSHFIECNTDDYNDSVNQMNRISCAENIYSSIKSNSIFHSKTLARQKYNINYVYNNYYKNLIDN